MYFNTDCLISLIFFILPSSFSYGAFSLFNSSIFILPSVTLPPSCDINVGS
jgi:hypothetical protein